jgi:hypothetical protein
VRRRRRRRRRRLRATTGTTGAHYAAVCTAGVSVWHKQGETIVDEYTGDGDRQARRDKPTDNKAKSEEKTGNLRT